MQNDYHQYLITDVFSRIPDITSKKMFGGFGYYQHGIIFAILADEQLYFKVGESNRADYESFGSKPFTYPMKDGKLSTLSYWALPEDILEDLEKLEVWIEKSVQESLKAKQGKKKITP